MRRTMVCVMVLLSVLRVHAAPASVEHVIHVTVDGLRADAVTTLGAAGAPNFYRLRAEGAYTDNARCDPDVSVTLPNHVCVLTSRAQLGTGGHNVTRNSDPGSGGALGSVGLTSQAGEFVRGAGALRIDDGSAANYVAVNGDVIRGAAGSNTLTVMAWFKFQDVGGNGSDVRNFLWETAPSAYCLSFGVRSDTADAQKHVQWFTQLPDASGAFASLPAVSDGQWHHAVVTVDELTQTVTYYHDGVLTDRRTVAGLVLKQAGAEQFVIGNHRTKDGTRNWDGFIDDMAVLDTALSSNVVAALYAGTTNVEAAAGAHLVAYWPFDADYASTTNNALYQGTPRSGYPTVHSDCAAAGGSAYVASVFDVAHDHGLRTAFYAGWNGFNYLDASWAAGTGAADATGADNGADKIDTYVLVTDDDIAAQTTRFLNDLAAAPYHYSLLHWHKTDSAGHGSGWMSAAYLDAVKLVDTQLGRLLAFVQTNAVLSNKTAIVLTADHGGYDYTHGDAARAEAYTIPLYIWGPGVARGRELYGLNSRTRANPGAARPTSAAVPQPIRNGDTGNLALSLLGLPAVPGSTINPLQNLNLLAPAVTRPSLRAVQGAQVQVEGTNNATTTYAVPAQTAGFDVSFRNGNFGDHELYSGGQRLAQEDGVIIGLANDGEDSIVQVGGNLTYVGAVDPRYDNGMGFAVADLSSGAEKNADFAFACFPFAAGWVGGHVATNGALLAGPNLPAGSSVRSLATRTWRGPGQYIVSLAGVDARADGMLFVVGADNQNNYTCAGVCEHADDVSVVAGDAALGDWHVHVRNYSQNDTSDVGENGSFSFLYVPYDTPDLIGGRVRDANRTGTNTLTVLKASGAWTVANPATGVYTLKIPDGKGGFLSDRDGVLLAAVSGIIGEINSANNQDPVEGNVLSWTFSGDTFTIKSFDAPAAAAQDPNDFVFAFIPYDARVVQSAPGFVFMIR